MTVTRNATCADIAGPRPLRSSQPETADCAETLFGSSTAQPALGSERSTNRRTAPPVRLTSSQVLYSDSVPPVADSALQSAGVRCLLLEGPITPGLLHDQRDHRSYVHVDPSCFAVRLDRGI